MRTDDHCRGRQCRNEARPDRYHIGGDTELTNAELARVVLDECGAGWDSVRMVADHKGHDYRYSLDDSRLRALGYSPATAFAAGLATTVAWYRQNRSWWEPVKQAVVPEDASGSSR